MLEQTEAWEQENEEEEVQAATEEEKEENFLGEIVNDENADADEDHGMLSKLGHQECARILTEIEATCEHLPEEAWLTASYVAPMLAGDLGYEDVDELEDALKGSLGEFIQLMPHFESKQVEPAGDDPNGETLIQFRMRELPEGPPRCIEIPVRSVRDLYRVVLKPPGARIIIPELEFEIGANQKKVIDTIYNHIGLAIFNIGMEIQEKEYGGVLLDRMSDIVAQLNILLDVNQPWHFVIQDPNGQCMVKPDNGYEILDINAFANDAPDSAESVD